MNTAQQLQFCDRAIAIMQKRNIIIIMSIRTQGTFNIYINYNSKNKINLSKEKERDIYIYIYLYIYIYIYYVQDYIVQSTLL